MKRNETHALIEQKAKAKRKKQDCQDGFVCVFSFFSSVKIMLSFHYIIFWPKKEEKRTHENEARILSFIFSLFPFHSFYFNKNIWLNFLVHHYNCWLFIVVLHILLLTFFFSLHILHYTYLYRIHLQEIRLWKKGVMIEWRDFYNIFLESLSLLIVFHFTLTLHYIINEICILFSFFIFVLIKRNETNAPLTSFPF